MIKTLCGHASWYCFIKSFTFTWNTGHWRVISFSSAAASRGMLGAAVSFLSANSPVATIAALCGPAVQRNRGQLFCWSDSQTQAKLAWLRPSTSSIPTAFTRFQRHLQAIKHTPKVCVLIPPTQGMLCWAFQMGLVNNLGYSPTPVESCCLGISVSWPSWLPPKNKLCQDLKILPSS